MNTLPSEIFFNIARFLDPLDIVTLQSVSKRFLELGRDDTLWREQCFNKSSFLRNLRRRRALLASESSEGGFRDLARALATGNGQADSRLIQAAEEAQDLKVQSNERIRIMANWEPGYPNERVRWYDEYIARHAPISTSWFQQPRNRDSPEHEYLEVRGMALYTPPGEDNSTFAVAPLDDGSVCLWDISGTRGRKGSIIARSKSGLISLDPTLQPGSAKLPKIVRIGVTECVSVDSLRKRAYFAVENGLVGVDLETLSTVSREKFPCSITALSKAKYPVPITVGTTQSLYLHDPRARTSASQTGIASDSVRMDFFDTNFGSINSSKKLDFLSLLNPGPSPLYQHMNHQGPLSILHLPNSKDDSDENGDIYVAGRFPSILSYDRRNFPKLQGIIHSGARLCGMAALPYPFSSREKDLARRGELSTEQAWETKTRPGKTLIACGEYNSKGSLEMYGLSPVPHVSTIRPYSSSGNLQNSVLKNRQTSSSSKLLSVSNHGTRVVVSDGGGDLKWLERDGFTEARRWNIAHGSVEGPRGIFGTLGDSYMDSGSGDIVIKLENTHHGRSDKPINEDDLILWTGEKIGLLSFSSKPGFTADTFDKTGQRTPEEAIREREKRTYSETMGRALEANANEVRWMRGLGLDPR